LSILEVCAAAEHTPPPPAGGASPFMGGEERDAKSPLKGEMSRSDRGVITFEYVSKVSGYFDVEKMVNLCVCIKDGDAENALRIFWEMYDNSLDCNNFCASLLEMFRNIQIAKIMENPAQYINLEKSEADKIIEAAKTFDSGELLRCNSLISEVIINLGRYTVNKRVAVEMMLIEMCLVGAPLAAPVLYNNRQLSGAAGNAGAASNAPTSRPFADSTQQPKPRRYFDKYADLVEEVGKENKMISVNLKGAKCIIDESAKKIIIYVESDFKVNILNDAKNLAVLQNNLIKFTGGGYSVVIELQKAGVQEEVSKNSIDDILNNAN